MLKPEFSDKKMAYIHHGVVGENGSVDINKIIDDPRLLNVTHEHYCHQSLVELGNVGIWYFDIVDSQNIYTIIVQFFFQTEPQKRELGLYGTIFTHTREFGIYNKSQKYNIDELDISPDCSDVTIKNNCISKKYNPRLKSSAYSLKAQIDDIALDLELIPDVDGWKPFGDQISFKDDIRTGSFSVICFTPRAKVNGIMQIRNTRYEIKNAIGYHDHTVWRSTDQVEKLKRRLFIDDVMSKWEFGKFVSSEYVIIFNSLYLRPWLNQSPINTFLVIQDAHIIHSSNNLIQVQHYDVKTDKETLSRYPSRIVVKLKQKDTTMKLDIKLNTIIYKKDLLEEVNIVARSLIRFIFGKPSSYYMISEADFTISGPNAETKSIKGSALYELLVLNDRPTRFEDYLRKILHMRIK